MFWGHYNISGGQPLMEMENIRAKASRAESKARTTEIDVGRLSERVESLTLACQAMWELLRDRTDLTDDDIQKRMKEIDLRDGQQDGRLKVKLVKCPDCGRTTNSRRRMCMYCGTEVESEHIFDQ